MKGLVVLGVAGDGRDGGSGKSVAVVEVEGESGVGLGLFDGAPQEIADAHGIEFLVGEQVADILVAQHADLDHHVFPFAPALLANHCFFHQCGETENIEGGLVAGVQLREAEEGVHGRRGRREGRLRVHDQGRGPVHPALQFFGY